MSSIVYKNVYKRYPKAQNFAVNNVNLEVEEGEFIVFLGPSGCGKTTLLKMTNRLYEVTEGTIEFNGKNVMDFKPEDLRRQIGYVIQQSGLFPHMTIEQNIAVVPRLLKWEEKKISERIDELLTLVHLDPTQFRKRYPSQLSGGQQQRVGIARALAANPSVLLMDEPFGAIDAITRTSLQDELHKIQREFKKTILFVTHDVDEALRLADKIVIMRNGEIIQFATPYEIISNPVNDFVKELVGNRDIFRKMNLLRISDILDTKIGSGEPIIQNQFTISIESTLNEAFTRLVETGINELIVVDENERKVDTITIDKIIKEFSLSNQEYNKIL